MIRWLTLGLGLASIALGVTGYLLHPPVAVNPTTVDSTQLVKLVDQGQTLFVTAQVQLDGEHPLYVAHSRRPHYSARSTLQTYELEDGVDLTKLLGSRVRLIRPLEPAHLTLCVVETGGSTQHVKMQRELGRAQGFDSKIWVLSTALKTDGEGRVWMQRQSHEGVFTRLKDLAHNLDSYALSFDAREIMGQLRSKLGVKVDTSTYLLITDAVPESSGQYHLPVAGTEGRVRVGPFFDGKSLPAWVQAGPVTGLLRVFETDLAADSIARILQVPAAGSRAVIYHDETAAEHNRKTTSGLWLFVGLGAGLLLLSSLAFALRRLRARRRPSP